MERSKQWWQAAHVRVKNVVEGPDRDIDFILQGVVNAEGLVPPELFRRFPILARPDVQAGIIAAVLDPSEEMPKRWDR